MRSNFGLPDQVSLRSMSTGTSTRQPFSASRRAYCDSLGTPGVKPTNISGVQSASGNATTWATAIFPFGSSNNPSPSTLGSTGQRTVYTLYKSVSATSGDGVSAPMYFMTTGETRSSTTPRSFFNRSRLGCTDFVYASAEEKSGLQYCLRFSTDAANSRIKYLSIPSTICAAMSPSRVSGFVSGNGSAQSESKDKMDKIIENILCRQHMKLLHADTSRKHQRRQTTIAYTSNSLGLADCSLPLWGRVGVGGHNFLAPLP